MKNEHPDYRLVTFETPPTPQQLHELTASGWRLVSVASRVDECTTAGGHYLVYLERTAAAQVALREPVEKPRLAAHANDSTLRLPVPLPV